jgi:hypothetical protein
MSDLVFDIYNMSHFFGPKCFRKSSLVTKNKSHFSKRCSTIPFCCGWYGIIFSWRMPLSARTVEKVDQDMLHHYRLVLRTLTLLQVFHLMKCVCIRVKTFCSSRRSCFFSEVDSSKSIDITTFRKGKKSEIIRGNQSVNLMM